MQRARCPGDARRRLNFESPAFGLHKPRHTITVPARVSSGSFTSPGHATVLRGMSAMPLIAPELMRLGELTRCASFGRPRLATRPDVSRHRSIPRKDDLEH